MATEIRMPDMGENVDHADVGQILVKVGDTVAADQNILELETEKAVFELPCPQAGKVAQVHVKEGETVKVGTLILTLEGGDGKPADTSKEEKKSPAKPSAQKSDEAKQPGKKESEPAPKPPAQPEAKEQKPQKVPADGRKDSEEKPAQPVEPRGPKREAEEREAPAPAAPATRRMARQFGVNLHEVAPTGPGGRITREDLQQFVRDRLSSPAGAIAPSKLPDFSRFGQVERVAMNKIAITAARGLTQAWQTIPHVTQHDDADITDLEAGRKRVNEARGKGSAKVTMTVLAMKAAVAAIKRFPHFGSSLDAATNEIVVKKYYHVGIAVDTEHGLLVPVVRDVDQKSIAALASEVAELADRARQRKLKPEEFEGGTFTITNLGGIAGTAFTPIIRAPEVAILGLSRSRFEPRYVGANLERRLILPLSLSYDHRVINGAGAARFLDFVAGALSDPVAMLFDL